MKRIIRCVYLIQISGTLSYISIKITKPVQNTVILVRYSLVIKTLMRLAEAEAPNPIHILITVNYPLVLGVKQPFQYVQFKMVSKTFYIIRGNGK